MSTLDQQSGENRRRFTTSWGAEYSTDCQTEDIELMELLRDPKTLDFIASNFKPREITIQEGEGRPVDTDTQKKILEAQKIILAHLVLTGNPLNEKPAEPISETASLQELTVEQRETIKRIMLRLREQQPKPEHPTNLLRPERINEPRTQATIKYLEDRNPGRLREFGTRLMYKLAERAISTKKHPIEALQGYNGLIIGGPNTKKCPSFTDLSRSRQASPEEIAYLINFEAENDLLNEEDLAEILQIAQSNPKIVPRLRSLKLLKSYPISADIIVALDIRMGELARITKLKAADDSLDAGSIDELTKLVLCNPPLAEELDGKENGHIKQVLNKAEDSTQVDDNTCKGFVRAALLETLFGKGWEEVYRKKFTEIPGVKELLGAILQLPGFQVNDEENDDPEGNPPPHEPDLEIN